ncbi:MAG TPA: DEAD/DEAH box helicase, partial [Candidatus Marinimicrobia bacterium]|nr:DEAD/DEAH box helicase [Candidatus Neomarinimicrobiota bacterium]
LDEADEMLTMGFKKDLEMILAQTPQEKQTLLFSATMSKRVVEITKSYMNNPLEIAAARMNIAAENVQHIYYMVNAKDRYEVIKRIIDINSGIYGIVFCRTRRETKEVANKLMHDGYNADTLHGDLSQMQRDEVMGRFRNRQLQILVATDVAARGLDVDDLSHVINFNLPDDDEIYVHRSGRTGRAGKKGISIIIIHTREMRKIREIEKKFSITFIRETVPSGLDICKKRLYTLIGKVENVEVDEQQIGQFMPDIYKKLEWLEREELVKHFVSTEFNRYLSYYKNARDINISGDSMGGERSKREKQSRGDQRNTSFAGFYVNVGFQHKLNPGRLIGLINECLRSGDAVIGKIEVMKTFSFFEIDNKWESKLFVGFKGKKFEGIPLLIE